EEGGGHVCRERQNGFHIQGIGRPPEGHLSQDPDLVAAIHPLGNGNGCELVAVQTQDRCHEAIPANEGARRTRTGVEIKFRTHVRDGENGFVATVLRLNRSEEHTSDSSHVEISYAVFCLKKKKLR